MESIAIRAGYEADSFAPLLFLLAPGRGSWKHLQCYPPTSTGKDLGSPRYFLEPGWFRWALGWLKWDFFPGGWELG